MAKNRRTADKPQRQAVENPANPGRIRNGGRRAAAGLVFLAVLVAAFFAWRLTSPPSTFEVRTTADQNVLLVTIDTWRADALGASGHGKVATPNLDRLAALGTRFDFAHAHAVVTLPAHTSILTGLYPFQHGVRENAGYRLRQDIPTLASMLHQAGLATGAFIGSFALDSRFGLNTGFDRYDEQYGKSNVNAGFVMPERRGDAVAAAATQWIGQQKGKWFAWVHLFDPHAPYQPPPPFDREIGGHRYYGEVAYTDHVLASLLDAARDPSGRPTLVVVTGDHGEGLGEHGEMTHGLFAYEGTLHVPLIVAQVDRGTSAWTGGDAGTTGRGRVSQSPAHHVDIVPTILAALGRPIPETLPGRPLSSRSTDGAAGYFEAMSASLNRGWAPLTGVLVGREKFISLPIPELYDLSQDPHESVNLVDTKPERQRVLRSRLDQLGVTAPGDRASESAESRAKLQALGYVTGSAPAKARYTEEDDPKRLIALDQKLRRAIELYERKQPLAAIPIYREVIAERPSMEVAYTELAMLQWEVGQPAEAVATLKAAIAAGNTGLAVRSRLGIYLAEIGRVDEALPLLGQAATNDSADVDVLNALGIATARAGRMKEAAATFARLLELDPSNTMAIENLGSIALSQGDWDEARRHFARALEADPSSPQAHNGMGVVEIKSGNRRAAIDHWRQAVARDPANFDALYNAATELVNDGRLSEARPYLEQFVRTAPPAFYAADIARIRGLLAKMQ